MEEVLNGLCKFVEDILKTKDVKTILSDDEINNYTDLVHTYNTDGKEMTIEEMESFVKKLDKYASLLTLFGLRNEDLEIVKKYINNKCEIAKEEKRKKEEIKSNDVNKKEKYKLYSDNIVSIEAKLHIHKIVQSYIDEKYGSCIASSKIGDEYFKIYEFACWLLNK